MRVVDAKEFASLGNVLFCEYRDVDFLEDQCFMIKWNTNEESCVYSHIGPSQVKYFGSFYEEGADQINKASEDSSFKVEMDFENTYRDIIEDGDKFAVYEKEDIQNIIETLQKLIEEK